MLVTGPKSDSPGTALLRGDHGVHQARNVTIRLTSTTTARRAMTPPDARYKPVVGATKGTRPAATHARLTASEPGDAADQPVPFLTAAYVQETLSDARPSARPRDRHPGPGYRVVLPVRSEGPTAAETAPGDGVPRSGTDATTSMPWWSLPPDPLVTRRR